ncbi:hypothetical protein [Sciscionella marina]|uniref:hypothetical protein n=1 Tax=Sciscionella marina TaxID=508770 RepID=UPI00037AD10D|nr:hypothetical protein [Sciscionella marina]
MFEEGSPEWHRVTAPFQDIIGELRERTDQRVGELEQELSEYEQRIAEREAVAREQLAEQEKARAELEAANPPDPWKRKTADTVLSFGPDEDEAGGSAFTPGSPQPPRRARRAVPEDDDEDFSNRSWLQH